jgi:TolB-like protein
VSGGIEGNGAADAASSDAVPEAWHAVVARMVAAGALREGARSHALLSYLLDHHVTAQGGAPKAYAIAVDVLKRPGSFDPARDGIVRVEIGRLRTILDTYFAGPGADEPVCFRLPRGQSGLVIEAGKAAPTPAAPPPAAPSRRIPRTAGMLLAGAAAAALLAAVAGIEARRAPAAVAIGAPTSPHVVVLPITDLVGTEETQRIAAGATGIIASELAHFYEFPVVLPSSGLSPTGMPGDFLLTGSLVPAADARIMTTLRLSRAPSDEVVWTGSLTGPAELAHWAGRAHEAAVRLGAPLGVIPARLRAEVMEGRWNDGRAEPTDFECYMLYSAFDVTKEDGLRRSAADCLEHRAAGGSTVGRIWSAAAFMHLLDWTERPPTDADLPAADDPLVRAALAAAHRSVLLEPSSAHGHEVLGSILTALGRGIEARAALDRARALNPGNPEIEVKLGWLDCLEGQWDSGTARIEAVVARYSAVPGWYRIPLALAALREGDMGRLTDEATAILASGDVRGAALLLASARREGAAQRAEAAARALEAQGRSPASAAASIFRGFPEASTRTLLLDLLP